MNSAFADWQSWAALVVVFGTAGMFLLRALRRKKKTAGCASCGSAPKPKVSVTGAKKG
jgi:hypothetical protein